MGYGREPQGLLLEDSYTTRTEVQEAKGVENGCCPSGAHAFILMHSFTHTHADTVVHAG